MSYQVIARKWRPQNFEEVTGQEPITRTLRNAIEHGRLHHAYIFSGSRGVGKTTTARLLAKALNCHKTEAPNPFPCSSADACVSCLEISESRSIDVFEFDAASHTGVDDIRDLILESININPARDRYKVFIIDEVHMLSKSSFNALLKTLEEPPPRVEFIMATTELHKLPDTIVSRCQQFSFRSIPLAKIYERLRTIATAEGIEISDDALREIARSGEGSMRDAQSNFDQVISFSVDKIETSDVVNALGIASAEMLTRVLRAITDGDPATALRTVDELVNRGQDLRNFCRDLLSFLRDLLIVKLAGSSEDLLDTAAVSREELDACAEPFSEGDLIRFFNSLSDTEARLKDARQPRHLLEVGLVKLIEMKRVTPIENLISRLSAFESERDLEPRESHPGSESVIGSPEKKTLKPDESSLIAPAGTAGERDLKAGDAASGREVPPGSHEAGNSGVAAIRPATPATGNKPAASYREPALPVLPPLSPEDLEHIEDRWLDAAFERTLLTAGDAGEWMAGAAELASRLVGEPETAAMAVRSASVGSSGGSRPSADPVSSSAAPESPVEDKPPFELPDDAAEDVLRRFAEGHPAVQRALRIFHGKIEKVERRPSERNG